MAAATASGNGVVDPKTGLMVTRDKSTPWYIERNFTEETLHADARELMEEYAGIPKNEVIKHLEDMRDKAWEVFPYPCIGQFSFLDVSLNRTPSLTKILDLLKSPDSSSPDGKVRYLDVGCGMGQNLRWLAHHGVPAERLYGAELEGGFLELGYELFRDRDRMTPKDGQPRMLTVDILAPDWGNPLTAPPLKNGFDVVHVGKVLHLFTEEEQTTVVRRCITELLRKPAGDDGGRGRWVLGSSLAHLEELPMKVINEGVSKDCKRHSSESFAKMVEGIAKTLPDRQLKLKSTYDDMESIENWRLKSLDKDTRILLWEIEVV